MKKIFLSLMLAILLSGVIAQQPVFRIHGRITYQETGAPAAGQPVIIAIDSLQNYGHYNKVITDAHGEYVDSMPFMQGIDQAKILVFTYDCRGDMVSGTGYFHTGKLEEVVNLNICGNAATKCEAFFNFSPNPKNQLELALYDASRYMPGSVNVNYLWDFGDGSLSTLQNPVHSYSKPGIYTICLRINSSDSTCSSSYCMQVTLGSPVPEPCYAAFSWYPGDSSGATFIFEAYTKQNHTGTFKWNFGDSTTAVGQKVSHTFSGTQGSFNVCLSSEEIASDGTLCTSVTCQEVKVDTPSACKNSFYYQVDSTGAGYTFVGWTKENTIDKWQWDFGDGTTSYGQKVWHIFTGNNSIYNVCLTTFKITGDSSLCTSTSCQEVFVKPPTPCNNHFEITSADNITFTFSGKVDAAYKATEYFWDFGDGNTATGPVVTHTFRGTKAEMFYKVCLTTLVPIPGTTGFHQCKSTSCQLVYPGNNMMCQAAMNAIPDSSGYSYRFENLSMGNPSLISWDFGDGMQSNQANPVHTYAKPGIYTACLFISDTLNNCWDNTCQEVWVNMIQPGCKASFYAVQAENAAGNSYSFINTSSPGFTNYFWSFGDGSVSDEANPVHSFAAPGVYNVCLTSWDAKGNCKDVYCQDIFYGKNTGEYKISGIVMAADKPANHGLVWLVGADNTYNDQALLDSAGNYNFNKVPAGAYYIYTMLTPGAAEFFTYMPTYYPNSLTWFDATVIHAGEPNAWYPIRLVPVAYPPNGQGTAVISGYINWEGQIKSPGSIPAAHVEVVLYNNAGKPVAYTFTDSKGYFEFNDLEFGNYTIHAEMTGKTTATAEISLSENESIVNINFAMNAEAIILLGTENRSKPQLVAGNPYPNPAGDFINLNVNILTSRHVETEITDMQGRVVKTAATMVQNNKLLQISTTGLNKGVYMLRIKTAGYQPIIRKFIK